MLEKYNKVIFTHKAEHKKEKINIIWKVQALIKRFTKRNYLKYHSFRKLNLRQLHIARSSGCKINEKKKN
jgi:hypothetical protein